MKIHEARLESVTLAWDIESLVRRLFAGGIDHGTVAVYVEERSEDALYGRSVSVTSTIPRSAPIVVFAENGGEVIYLSIGENSTFEVPLHGHRYTSLEGPQELLTLIHAVARGGFEETVWTQGSRIVKSVGRVFLQNGDSVEIRESQLRIPFVSLKRKTTKYFPYPAECFADIDVY